MIGAESLHVRLNEAMREWWHATLAQARCAGWLAWTLRLMGFGVAFSFVVLAWWAPVYQSWKGFPAGEWIYHLLNPFCHQYPTRSLWVWDRPFALCARCFAGYLGVAVACLLFWRPWGYGKRLIYGLLLLAPGVIDPLVQWLTPYESTNTLRFVTGFSGGIGVFLVAFPLSLKSIPGRTIHDEKNVDGAGSGVFAGAGCGGSRGGNG